MGTPHQRTVAVVGYFSKSLVLDPHIDLALGIPEHSFDDVELRYECRDSFRASKRNGSVAGGCSLGQRCDRDR